MSFALIHSVMWVSAIVLVTVNGGCGSSVSDEAAKPLPVSPVGTNYGAKANTSYSLPAGDTTMVEKKLEGNVNGTASVNLPGDHASASISSIPPSVAKDMQSPEPRDRYRALDYWEAQDSNAPLDPVFEAIEDDDPAVRAKATAIVDRYWAAEEEQENQ